MDLHDIIESIKWTKLKMALFYESDYGLRFDTRTPNMDIENLNYFDNAVEKAIRIFLDVFEEEKTFYIVINSVDDKDDFDINNWSLADEILDCFNISNVEYISESIPYIYADDDLLISIRTIIKVKKNDFDYYEMIKRICQQDLGRSPCISDEVFILNNGLDIAYNFYDDRGVDLAAQNSNLLKKVYELRKAYLYDYEYEHVIKL